MTDVLPDQVLPQHRAGFVSIVGKPNVGKSTLMNALVGEHLSIITYKAQTTRHRIMGILNGDDFQIVYSDTPGIIQPKYELQQKMMRFVHTSLEDADIILFVTDIFEKHDESDVTQKLSHTETPIFVLINKTDLATEEQIAEKVAYWKETVKAKEVIPISALKKNNIDLLFQTIIANLPDHPPYFPKDELTDKPERFFASEILREKIFLNYDKEVPYSCEVVITSFKDKKDILVIQAEIMVERTSQRAILLGHKGENIKKVGMQARKDMEEFFGRKVFLETFVKVEADWRSRENTLRRFGYSE
ncbi:GTPase Era [Cytophagaceae bacterium DM2B3-1]|uniref:GTPase Era n=1 Tax=Xanthocytophaga flava TaxID=3048013 RepID=A0AAE3QV71_9BACT|nr:GTPase Era [Xanthocytophaga flavus]MDJ1469484.1 GTPase Era [Xanthocytophaga flavus]MDJ1483880.1 GTPase Era [Xanthocytophaga flavus]MDJ1494003.1 GTPase Era [Xanthocytophaga flavus]